MDGFVKEIIGMTLALFGLEMAVNARKEREQRDEQRKAEAAPE